MIPMFGEMPIEMRLKGRDAHVATDLQGVALYRQLFAVAFGGDASPIRTETIVRSIAAFQRTILSFNAPIDRYRRGDASALSAAAVRGMALFDSRGCVQCHAGERLHPRARTRRRWDVPRLRGGGEAELVRDDMSNIP